MNINILEDVKENCRRAMYQEVMSRSNKELYDALERQFNRLMETVEEQNTILRNMAALSEEAGNSNLAADMESLCRQLNSEYSLMEESKSACRYAANK